MSELCFKIYLNFRLYRMSAFIKKMFKLAFKQAYR